MKEKDRIILSKTLSYICRHGAEKEDIEIKKDGGWIKILDILEFLNKKSKFNNVTNENIKDIVSSCSKNRFSICVMDNNEYIRANQGGSIKSVNLNLIELEINDKNVKFYHGTNDDAVNIIMNGLGLSKMKRTHIHMNDKMPNQGEIISGMRSSCTKIIIIDVDKTKEFGIKFFISSNKVILSEGITDKSSKYYGFIPKECLTVIDR